MGHENTGHENTGHENTGHENTGHENTGHENAGREAALAAADACAAQSTRVAVLVEGRSDRAAVLTLAARLGRDLAASRIAVVPMGGARNIGHFASALGPPGLGLRLAGLCDEQEAGDFLRGLLQAGLAPGFGRAGLAPGPGRIGVASDPGRIGLAPGSGRAGLEVLGFHVCVADLEDEMIRALGADAVARVIAEQGESRRLRTFLKQPAQRDRPPEARLRRFIGTHSGAKLRYGAALAAALDLARLPRPLENLLAYLESCDA